MSKTAFYTDDGNRILAGAGMTFAECTEMWRRLHGGHIVAMKVELDPIDINAIDLGTAPLTDYSNVEHVELDLDLPSGLCKLNEDGSCSIKFKE